MIIFELLYAKYLWMILMKNKCEKIIVRTAPGSSLWEVNIKQYAGLEVTLEDSVLHFYKLLFNSLKKSQ